MPYQGVALAFLLGIGIATVAVLYFLGQRELEPPSNHGTNRRLPPSDPGSYSHSWDSRNGNAKLRKPKRHKRRDQNETKCVICLEEFDFGDTQMLKCEHKFHSKCINRWLDVENGQKCPLCREFAARI